MALGACIATAFARYGWFGSILGIESGLAEGLPTRVQALGFSRGWEIETSIEVVIGERAGMALPKLGFIPLLTHSRSGQAVLFSVPSCHRPKLYGAKNFHWRQLTYILTASRFMHYLGVIGRDRGNHTRIDWERLLNSWIREYVTDDEDGLSSDLKAQYPLTWAAISVTDSGKPGVYVITAYLCPHFQLETPSSNGVFHTKIGMAPLPAK